MKHIASDHFGNIPSPSNFNELMEFVEHTSKSERNVVRMWRGQADVRWQIDSTAYRRLSLDGNPTEGDISFYEKNLIKHATHKGYRNVNGLKLSDFDLLARLQHHGAATRLIDASRNVLVALYFACATAPRTDGVLLGLHTDYLGGYEAEPKEDDYDQVVAGLEDILHPQTWEPPAITPRISAQSAQFLYSAVAKNNFGSLHIDKKKDALIALAISSKLKSHYLEVLARSFDIRRITLFPDIDGFCAANRSDVGRWEIYRW